MAGGRQSGGVAVAVLVAGPHCGTHGKGMTEHLCLGPTLSNLALSWELIDPREEGLLFARRTDYLCDVELVQRRYADLSALSRVLVLPS